MSAFKKFNTQDVYVSTYTAHKSWEATGSQYSDYGIVKIPAHSGSGVYLPDSVNLNNGYDRRLAYQSLVHLYYSSFENGEILTGSAYENYLQSSFNVSGSRILEEVASITSLPKGMYGTAIKPKSLEISPDSGAEEYVSASATETGVYHSDHIETLGFLYDSIPVIAENASSNQGLVDDPALIGDTQIIVDDGEGNLFRKKAIGDLTPITKVGNVIYPQGQIIITDPIIARYFNNYVDGNIKWKSTQPIYTYNFHCKMKENEFTHTFNPSAVTGSNGIVAGNVAGEEFSPYFTTIGLYNDSNELIALAKTGQPIPIPKDTDMTVVVKLDI